MTTGDGRERLYWEGPRGAVDLGALNDLLSFWHPSLLAPEEIVGWGDSIRVLGPCVAPGGRGELQANPDLGLSVPSLSVLQVEDSRGGHSLVPLPSWWSGSSRPAAAGVLAAAGWLRHGPRPESVAAVHAALGRVGVHRPQAIVLRAASGSGRTTLLRSIAVAALAAGADVITSIDDLGRVSEDRVGIVLLDDETGRGLTAADQLGRVAARCCHELRRVVVVVVSDLETAVDDPPGIDVEAVTLPALGTSTLLRAVRHQLRDRASAAVLAAQGRPLRLRLLLEWDAREPDFAAAVAARVGSLSAAATAALAAVALAGTDRLPPAVIDAMLLGAARHELRNLLVDSPAGCAAVCPEVASAVLSRFDGDAIKAIAARAHRALDGRNPILGARFLALCGAELSMAQLAPVAEESARRGLARLAELADLGVEPGPEWTEMQSDLLARCGRSAEAASLLLDLAHDAPGIEEARLRSRGARLLAEAGDQVGAASALAGLEPPDGISAIEIGRAQAHLAEQRGRFDAARRCLEAVLTQTGATAERAAVLRHLGGLVSRSGDRRGNRILAEARTLYEELDIPGGLSRVLTEQGRAAGRKGEFERARRRHLLALERCLVEGDSTGAATCHVDLALVADERGALREAEQHLQRASSLIRTAGDAAIHSVTRAGLIRLAIELGRPLQALRDIDRLESADRMAGFEVRVAWDGLLRGLAAIQAARPDAAVALSTAKERLRELEQPQGEARACLGLAQLAKESNQPAQALALAEAGLRALGSVRAESLRLRLQIGCAYGFLGLGQAAKADGVLARELRHWREFSDPSLRAEVATLVAAIVVAEHPRDRRTRLAFDEAIQLAEHQERPDVRGRALAAALLLARPLFDDCEQRLLGSQLEQVYGGELQQRMGVLGVDGIVRTGQAALQSDALLRVDQALRRTRIATTDGTGDGLSSALEVLASRVPHTRAGLLVDDDGIRVIRRETTADGAPPSGPLGLAVLVAERARATLGPVVLADLGRDPVFVGHPEVAAAKVADVLVVGSRNSRLMLYLDRRVGLGSFSDVEREFATAFVERLALEPEVSGARLTDRDVDSDQLDGMGIIGRSGAVQELRRELRTYGPFDVPVFLSGESGTGKELAARALHQLSPRRGAASITVNCAAFAETLLESELFGVVKGAFSGADSDRPGLLAQADGGTMFLDEVGELSLGFQAKLLRVVEQGEYRSVGSSRLQKVDVRFLCATNRDIATMVADGSFREDLFYRLMATATVRLPALRERVGDLPLLVSHFAKRAAEAQGRKPISLSDAALTALEAYAFPGNVRELERMVTGLSARSKDRKISLADLPVGVRGRSLQRPAGATLVDARNRFERGYLVELLSDHGNNKTRAARTAGVARQTLLVMLKRHGLAGGALDDSIESAS